MIEKVIPTQVTTIASRETVVDKAEAGGDRQQDGDAVEQGYGEYRCGDLSRSTVCPGLLRISKPSVSVLFQGQ